MGATGHLLASSACRFPNVGEAAPMTAPSTTAAPVTAKSTTAELAAAEPPTTESPSRDRSSAVVRLGRALLRPTRLIGEASLEQYLCFEGFRRVALPTRHGDVSSLQAVGGTSQAPPLVFFHGLAGSAPSYYAPLLALRPFCSYVVMPELPQHGQSLNFGKWEGAPPQQPLALHDFFMEAINEALHNCDHLRAPPLIVGHSTGGYVAAQHVLQMGDDSAAGLFLISPDGADWTDAERAKMRACCRVLHWRDGNELARYTWPTSVEGRLLGPWVGESFADPSVRYLTESDLFQPVLDVEQWQKLPANGRTTVLWGKHEAFNQPHHGEYIRRHLPPGSAFLQPETAHGDIVSADTRIIEPIKQVLKDLTYKGTGT